MLFLMQLHRETYNVQKHFVPNIISKKHMEVMKKCLTIQKWTLFMLLLHIHICLEKNKNVLCEKPLTANAQQAHEIIKLAEDKKLLLTEAIWPRYMPLAKIIVEEVNSGIIGEVFTLRANLGVQIDHIQRLIDPNLADRIILDLNTSPFAAIVFGSFTKDAIENLCR